MTGIANRVRVFTATTGTSTISLGAAYGQNYLSATDASLVNGREYVWLIEQGTDFELVRGNHASSGSTASRTTVLVSKISGTVGTSKISLNGTAVVSVVHVAEEMLQASNNLSELADKGGALTTLGGIGGSTGNADNILLRSDGTGGGTAQSSPVFVSDVTGALSRSTGGGIPVQGTNTNDSAASGYVGEYVSSSVAFGSSISLTTGTATNLTSVSLTAGDWDVRLIPYFNTAASTSVTSLVSSISTTSATGDFTPGFHSRHVMNATVFGAANPAFGLPIPPVRLSLSSTTTVYGVITGTFSASTLTAWGLLSARRVR